MVKAIASNYLVYATPAQYERKYASVIVAQLIGLSGLADLKVKIRSLKTRSMIYYQKLRNV